MAEFAPILDAIAKTGVDTTGWEMGDVAHWIAAPMNDVGALEQFHEVVERAELIIAIVCRGESA